MTEEYQYEIDSHTGDTAPGTLYAIPDSKEAGERYRKARKSIASSGEGGGVELYRRKIGPRELVEKAEIPRKEP